MVSRTEKVYVLFGSQTGNSEDYAKTFADELPDKLSPAQIQKLAGTSDEITLKPKCMQLDDFLELEKADWTRLVVIFVSSYGVGQAPLGCYRFRDLCDAWKDRKTGPFLEGVKFAICGLGDSSYTTFFQNPTALDEAMRQVGAIRLGEVGKADAQQPQAPVVAKWKETMWKPLAETVAEAPLEKDKLKAMQDQTIKLCVEINPEFEALDSMNDATNKSKMADGKKDPSNLIIPAMVALLAIMLYFGLLK